MVILDNAEVEIDRICGELVVKSRYKLEENGLNWKQLTNSDDRNVDDVVLAAVTVLLLKQANPNSKKNKTEAELDHESETQHDSMNNASGGDADLHFQKRTTSVPASLSLVPVGGAVLSGIPAQHHPVALSPSTNTPCDNTALESHQQKVPSPVTDNHSGTQYPESLVLSCATASDSCRQQQTAVLINKDEDPVCVEMHGECIEELDCLEVDKINKDDVSRKYECAQSNKHIPVSKSTSIINSEQQEILIQVSDGQTGNDPVCIEVDDGLEDSGAETISQVDDSNSVHIARKETVKTPNQEESNSYVAYSPVREKSYNDAWGSRILHTAQSRNTYTCSSNQGHTNAGKSVSRWHHLNAQGEDEFLATQTKSQELQVSKRNANYICACCQLPMNSSSDVRQHFFKHGQNKCPVCCVHFSGTRCFSRHCKKHFEKITYSCFMCPSAFNRKDNLVRHLALKHNIKDKVACEFQLFKQIPGRNNKPLLPYSRRAYKNVKLKSLVKVNFKNKVNKRKKLKQDATYVDEAISSEIWQNVPAGLENGSTKGMSQANNTRSILHRSKESIMLENSAFGSDIPGSDQDTPVPHVSSYTCAKCSETFTTISELKYHVVVSHSEQKAHFLSSDKTSEFTLDSASSSLNNTSYSLEELVKQDLDGTLDCMAMDSPAVTTYCQEAMTQASEHLVQSGIGFFPLSSLLRQNEQLQFSESAAGTLPVKQEVITIQDDDDDSVHEDFGPDITENVDTVLNNSCDVGTPNFHVNTSWGTSASTLSPSIITKNIGSSQSQFVKTTFRRRRHKYATRPEICACNFCKETLTSAQEIVMHSDIHFNNTSSHHSCPVCLTKLTTKATLYRHCGTHLFVGSFPCTKCTVVFNRKDNLKRHMKIYHNIDLVTPKMVP